MSRFNCIRRRGVAICCYGLLFLSLSAEGAEPATPSDRIPGFSEPTAPFDRTPGFDFAYAISFWADDCGEFLLGELWRHALVAKLASCPFTEAARQRFRELAATNEAKARAAIGRYWEEHKGPMEYVPDSNRSCADVGTKPEVAEMRRRLARFAAGEISVGEALPESCADGATPAPL